MNRTRLFVLLCSFLSVGSLGHTQTVMLDLPLQSQRAEITQRIGKGTLDIFLHIFLNVFLSNSQTGNRRS